MRLIRDHNLQTLNTLAVPAQAEYFCAVKSVDDLGEALTWAKQNRQEVHILGGGSNVIMAPQIRGLVIHIQLMGKTLVAEDTNTALVQVGAGENWHDFVTWTLAQGLYGLENLALIPGTVGAAPVQNIGAYGVEVRRFIESVDVILRQHFSQQILSNSACEFAYRESIFKGKLRDNCVITQVTLRLHKTPRVEVSYPALLEVLPQNPNPQQVFDAVCQIRRSKLPDPQATPNCGSFFKNPLVALDVFQQLQTKYPKIPSYSAPDLQGRPQCKLAAAWLIDQAGWKGRQFDGAGVHHLQALVLTNTQGQPAEPILHLAKQIQCSVQDRFGVALELEPQLMGAWNVI